MTRYPVLRRPHTTTIYSYPKSPQPQFQLYVLPYFFFSQHQSCQFGHCGSGLISFRFSSSRHRRRHLPPRIWQKFILGSVMSMTGSRGSVSVAGSRIFAGAGAASASGIGAGTGSGAADAAASVKRVRVGCARPSLVYGLTDDSRGWKICQARVSMYEHLHGVRSMWKHRGVVDSRT